MNKIYLKKILYGSQYSDTFSYVGIDVAILYVQTFPKQLRPVIENNNFYMSG